MFGCTPISTKKHSENNTAKKTETYDKIVMHPELKDFNIAFDSLTDFRYLAKFKDTFRISFYKLQKIFQANKVDIVSKTEIGVKHTSIGDINVVQNIYQSAIHNSMETIYNIKGNAFFGGSDVVDKISIISHNKLNCRNYSFYFSFDSESILVYDSTINVYIRLVDSSFRYPKTNGIFYHTYYVLDKYLFPIAEISVDSASNITYLYLAANDYYTEYVPKTKMHFNFFELRKVLFSKEGFKEVRTFKLTEYSILLPEWYFKPY